MKHPLINDASKHYEMIDGIQSIAIMENMFTLEELKAWAKLTYMKYQLRLGSKGSQEDWAKDVIKRDTYKAYYEYLQHQPKTKEKQ